MNKLKNIRLLIAGGGNIGKRHANVIKNIDQLKLVGIADPNIEIKSLCQSLGVSYGSDLNLMMKDRNIDGVIVASPTDQHYSNSKTALKMGAHVLIEKPITEKLDDAIALRELAYKKNRRILVGHHRRYNPELLKAKQLIENGYLGKVIGVNGQWTVRKHTEYYNPEWRRSEAHGPIMINLVHEIDSLRFLFGDIISIYAESASPDTSFEKEDITAIVLNFCSGVLGTFLISDRTQSPWSWEHATGENPNFPKHSENTIRILGTKKSLEFPNLKSWGTNKEESDWRDLMASTCFSSEPVNAFAIQCAHFKQVILNEQKPVVTVSDAIKTLAATRAVLESVKKEKRIFLNS